MIIKHAIIMYGGCIMQPHFMYNIINIILKQTKYNNYYTFPFREDSLFVIKVSAYYTKWID